MFNKNPEKTTQFLLQQNQHQEQVEQTYAIQSAPQAQVGHTPILQNTQSQSKPQKEERKKAEIQPKKAKKSGGLFSWFGGKR